MFDKIRSVFRQKGLDKNPEHPHYEPDEYLEQPRPGLLRQQRVTYEADEHSTIRKKTVTRNYMPGANRYQDSHTTEVIVTQEQLDKFLED